jgi:hypothetical protein
MPFIPSVSAKPVDPPALARQRLDRMGIGQPDWQVTSRQGYQLPYGWNDPVRTQSYKPERIAFKTTAPLGESTMRSEYPRIKDPQRTISCKPKPIPCKYDAKSSIDTTQRMSFNAPYGFDNPVRTKSYAPERIAHQVTAPLETSTNRAEYPRFKNPPRTVSCKPAHIPPHYDPKSSMQTTQRETYNLPYGWNDPVRTQSYRPERIAFKTTAPLGESTMRSEYLNPWK